MSKAARVFESEKLELIAWSIVVSHVDDHGDDDVG